MEILLGRGLQTGLGESQYLLYARIPGEEQRFAHPPISFDMARSIHATIPVNPFVSENTRTVSPCQGAPRAQGAAPIHG